MDKAILRNQHLAGTCLVYKDQKFVCHSLVDFYTFLIVWQSFSGVTKYYDLVLMTSCVVALHL